MPLLGSICAMTIALACWADDSPATRTAPKATPRLGMNLAGMADWNTELPFVDVFRMSRPWVSQKEGSPWGQGPKLELDAHGWVKRLEPGCWAETIVCTIEGGHYPGGEYTVLFDGHGRLDASNAGQVSARAPGRLTLKVDPKKGSLFLQLRETDPADPIRAIRVLMPGTEQTYRENPWNRPFLDRWRGVACLRFMDMMATNGSPSKTWADRPTLEDATFSEKGVPAELLIDLANRQKADAWFCIHHQADDGYVRSLAELVKKRLDPKLKAYVEYSNEVWNGSFAQNRYAGEQGQALKFAEKPWEAAWKYTGYRSTQIFRIWEEVFGGPDRLVRVLASQAANAYVAEQIVTFQDAYKHADALAIAPYVSMNVVTDGKPGASEVAGWSVTQVLDRLEKQSLPESVGWIKDNKKVADRYGLKLIAYEGGQHMVGVMGAENNENLTKLLTTANADPRMETIYRAYLDAWEKEGGDLLCYFSSIGTWSKWGSWGLLQYADDDPAKSPKFMAVMRWAASLGQKVNLPGEKSSRPDAER